MRQSLANIKPRGRDLDLPFSGKTGLYNAITDVPGVEVGYTTIIQDKGSLNPIRTGITAILPVGKQESLRPIWAGTYNLNGNGEMTGTHWINDAGYFLSPICITNTHAVGMVHHATVGWMIEQYQKEFANEHLWAMPVVAETYDGVLNDINGRHIQEKHVVSALNSAISGPIREGNVGGGTGMICYQFKGGTGTASRVVKLDNRAYTIGCLLQANHGTRDRLTILGVPVGKHITKTPFVQKERGSIIVIIGTDLPMLPIQLRRVAKRAAIGIGRTGTPGGNSSGDIFLAFSTANEMKIAQKMPATLNLNYINDEQFDEIYEATCQAVEEAIINAMLAAESMTTFKPDGFTVEAIDHDDLIMVMRQYNRLL